MRILCCYKNDEDSTIIRIIVEYDLGTVVAGSAGQGWTFTELPCVDLACVARCWRSARTNFAELQVGSMAEALGFLGRPYHAIAENAASQLPAPFTWRS